MLNKSLNFSSLALPLAELDTKLLHNSVYLFHSCLYCLVDRELHACQLLSLGLLELVLKLEYVIFK